MLIAVDEDIPFAAQTFARFGEIRALPAREMTAAALRDADALVVRSVTRVNAKLLDATRVRFVGTAASGTDHVELPYLRSREIAFAGAPGANANAVAEYVVAALLHLRENDGLDLSRASLGIVGFGHVGRRVARYAAALGLRIVVNDPPLGRSTCEPFYRPLDDVLRCDVITLHVPLERAGPDPTHHLVNDAFLGAMKSGAFLVNTSRGAVADCAALRRALAAGQLAGPVLDVWENEPVIDCELARACRIATAHIAGHTLDAKIAAVNMIEAAFAAHFRSDLAGASPRGRPIPHGDPGEHEGDRRGSPLPPQDSIAAEGSPAVSCTISDAVRHAFDLNSADRRLRDTLGLPAAERAAAFDALRAGWPSRREFHVGPISFEEVDDTNMRTLRALGFRAAAMAGGASG